MLKLTSKILWKGIKNSYYSATFRPFGAIVFLTYRCTSQCKACNIWQRPVHMPDELNWEQWQTIFENMAKNGVKSVELFGGDALLRKDLLCDMIRFCRDHNMATYFPTDSSSISQELADELVEAGLENIYFSLDETSAIEGQVRGVKRHESRVKASIARLKAARGDNKYPRITCISTISNMNYRYIFQFASIARDAGADNFEVRGLTDFRTQSLAESMVNGVPPDPYFTATNSKQHAFSPSQANELLRMLETLWRMRDEYSPLHVQMTNMQGIEQQNLTEMVYPSHDCHFCTNYVVVSPYGDVMPCPYFNKYELGNLLQDDLKDVWGNDKHRHFCDKQKKDEIDLCRYCSIKHYHKGFADSSKEVLWLAGKKVSRAVSTMTSTIIDEHPLFIKSVPVKQEGISLTPAAKIINVVNLDSARTGNLI